MIDSWKQFWFSEQSVGRSLCLLGVAFGLIVGIFCKDWAESFRSIQLIGYRIPPLVSFGAAIGLDVLIISVVAIWIALNRNSKLYEPVTWFLFGIPFGILTIFNVFSDRLVSFGFICAYIPALIPFPLMIIVGMDAMCFLWINALFLLPFYIVSTGIIWLLTLSRSMA
jgi:hypothetical protein